MFVRRLIAPNVQKKVFLPGGATATSTSAVQVRIHSYISLHSRNDHTVHSLENGDITVS